MITPKGSHHVPYDLGRYRRGRTLRVGDSLFTPQGIKVDIHTDSLNLTGKIFYECPTAVSGDIMGPFRFLPMECRHEVRSLYHRLTGKLTLDGEILDFTDGRGYIEGDSGRSFPRRYTWVQSNDFSEKCSVMASAALIPFGKRCFWGCAAVVWFRGVEYRLATYTGAKIVARDRKKLVISQRSLILDIELPDSPGLGLLAPAEGKMCRSIRESAAAPVRFCLSAGDRILFDQLSQNASFEFVE